jgi:hypothetical protein
MPELQEHGPILKVLPPPDWKKYRPHHDVEVPFARSITDVTGMSPQWRRNGNMHVGYSG